MGSHVSVVGVPNSLGACAIGQERAPEALRKAGLIAELRSTCADVIDRGDSSIVAWRPDPTNPRAQNVAGVVDQVRTTAARVAAELEAGRTTLVLGGDCTIGIGTVAAARQTLGSVGLIYFDLHADMNTRESVIDGALDWMGVAHMLGLDGTEPTLASAVLPAPLVRPDQVVLLGHDNQRATPWERDQITTLGVHRVGVDAVAEDPIVAAGSAVRAVGLHADRFVVHFDVDVVDFSDAPLSENPGRNTGVSLATAMKALQVLLAADQVAALTVAELNPEHAMAVEGLIERFSRELARAFDTTT